MQSLSKLTQCMRAQLHPTLCDPRLLRSWNFPGMNTGVDCDFQLQGSFLTQGLNLCLLHWRWILYRFLLSHQGSSLSSITRLLKWQRQAVCPTHHCIVLPVSWDEILLHKLLQGYFLTQWDYKVLESRNLCIFAVCSTLHVLQVILFIFTLKPF